jgi:hypothetical protein
VLHRLESAIVDIRAAGFTSRVDRGRGVAALVADRGPAALRSLTCRFDITYPARDRSLWDEMVAGLRSARGLPALTELAIAQYRSSWWNPSPEDYGPLLTGSLLPRLSRLVLHASAYDTPLATWISMLQHLAIPEVALVNADRFIVRREGKRYRLAEVEVLARSSEWGPIYSSTHAALKSLAATDFADEIQIRTRRPDRGFEIHEYWIAAWNAMEEQLAKLPTKVKLV